MARSIAVAHTGVVDKETREAEGGHQTVLAARAVHNVVCGPGEDGLKGLRPILAELEIWVIGTSDFCGMGTRSKG
jgi:hypothetical protein